MNIYLAGYNVDKDVLDELTCDIPERQDVTPETLSAAYARISRDARPINELRKASRAEVDKARKSNSSIIFKMGHHSVAEHAVFNFDIIGVSRFAVENLEHHRLCSFTEKSQRYITLESDYTVPEEIKGTSLENLFIDTVKKQNELYVQLNSELIKYVNENNKELAANPKNTSLLEGWAKEDARYITPLAAHAQLGLTLNARNLELMLRRFSSQSLTEVKQLSAKLFSLVERIAPSIILFAEANDFDSKTYGEIGEKAIGGRPQATGRRPQALDGNLKPQDSKDVKLLSFTQDADDMLVASLLFAVNGKSFSESMAQVKDMSFEQKKEVVKASGQHMQFYDTMLREYENVDLTFEVVLSSACFGQLKRHRMATIIKQAYDPALGLTIPEAVAGIGKEKQFIETARQSEDVYEKILAKNPQVAPYILTNASDNKVMFPFKSDIPIPSGDAAIIDENKVSFSKSSC